MLKNINVSHKLDNNFDINRIIEFFPEANIHLHLAKIEFDLAKKNLISMKFNGKIIREKYGLSGKELGESIKKFKKELEKYDFITFEDFILLNEIDRIYEVFEEVNNIK